MRRKPPGRLDAALSILAITFLITLFLLAGGRNAILRAYTAPAVTLNGDFTEWTDAPTWSDTQNLPGANDYPPDNPKYDPNDEPVDQKEIQFVEDIRRASCIENADGLWFKIDRWEKNGGIGQPVYYCVYFDLDLDHPDPHHDLPKDGDWYERLENYDCPTTEAHPPDGVGPNDWILYCAFDPEATPSAMAHAYLIKAANVIPDWTEPPSRWPDTAGPIEWEAWGAWGEAYNKTTGLGGLSVEFGIPAPILQSLMDITPGEQSSPFQFFFSATLNDPLNKGFYPQQDFCPDGYDINRYDIAALGVGGSILLLIVVGAIVYGTIRRSRPRAPTEVSEP